MAFYGTTYIHIHTQNHTTTHGNNLGQQKTLEIATPYCISFNDKYIVFLLFISKIRDVGTIIRTMAYTYPFFTKRPIMIFKRHMFMAFIKSGQSIEEEYWE